VELGKKGPLGTYPMFHAWEKRDKSVEMFLAKGFDPTLRKNNPNGPVIRKDYAGFIRYED